VIQLQYGAASDRTSPKVPFPRTGVRPRSAPMAFHRVVRGQLQPALRPRLENSAGATSTDFLRVPRREGRAHRILSTPPMRPHPRLKDGNGCAGPRRLLEARLTATGPPAAVRLRGLPGRETPARSTRPGRIIPVSSLFRFRGRGVAAADRAEDHMSTNSHCSWNGPRRRLAPHLRPGPRYPAPRFGYDNKWFLSADLTGRNGRRSHTGTVITRRSTPFSGNVARPRPLRMSLRPPRRRTRLCSFPTGG